MKAYPVSVATIQIVLPRMESADAADFISEMMRQTAVIDWSYVKVGGQFLYATDANGVVTDDGEWLGGSV